MPTRLVSRFHRVTRGADRFEVSRIISPPFRPGHYVIDGASRSDEPRTPAGLAHAGVPLHDLLAQHSPGLPVSSSRGRCSVSCSPWAWRWLPNLPGRAGALDRPYLCHAYRCFHL